MRALVLISLWLGALLLIPSGAHVLEMPHKLAMDRAAYFSAQQMYLGWALFGVPIVLKIILDAALAFVWRRTSRPCGLRRIDLGRADRMRTDRLLRLGPACECRNVQLGDAAIRLGSAPAELGIWASRDCSPNRSLVLQHQLQRHNVRGIL